MRILIISIFIACLTFGCYYDNEEYLYPSLSSDCDTTDVSYALDVQPILSTYCYTCHSNSSAATLGGNIMLEDFTDVNSRATQVLNSIKHNPGISPMPKGSTKLSDCKIITFEAWINQGKPDN